MSTIAAQIHLRRYHYYFSRVAKFADNDAWLFTITAFNWGSGNVKRLLAEMEGRGIALNFSNFYLYLHRLHQSRPGDHSLKAATEYLPKLWNISQLLVMR